jgi:hypothetical protein
MSKNTQCSDSAQKGPGVGKANPKAAPAKRPASIGTASRVQSHSRGKDGKTR